jgi:hypothetical protein
MSTVGLRALLSRVLAPAAVAALALACLAAAPASAAVPDACGLTTESKIAKAFGLTDAVKHISVLAAPGNPSGVVRVGCRVFAWSGAKPTNAKQKSEGLLAGTMARLNVQTWVTDQSPYAPSWLQRFDATLKRLRGASGALFLKSLDGTAFVPPKFGAEEAIAYRGDTQGTRRARALWWNRRDKSMIEMNVVTAKGEPAVASLRRIAAVVVSRFNAYCIYPCQPPSGG